MTPSMISLLIAIVCSVPWVNGQFPKVCVNLESLKNKTCCPKPNGYHEPCGSDGNRGECQELRVRRWDGTYSHYQEFHRKDERHNWPNALFNRTCKCKSNFAGYLFIYLFIYYFPTIKITQALHYTKMWRGDLRKPQGLYEEAPSI